MFEYVGNIHMHTPYSDGSKWHRELADTAIEADLDFIIVTDHNVWVDGVEGYYQNNQGKVLLLVGEEIHDPRRHPQANHFLAFGAMQELSSYAHNTTELMNVTQAAGGYGFLAHPFDPAAPTVGEDALGWQDWDIEGYCGLEIWNYMSEFKGYLGGNLRNLKVALNPEKYISGADARALKRWDELLRQGKRICAIGGSDAHGHTFSLGPMKRTIFPYDYLFRTVNMHVLLNDELSGDKEEDGRLIVEAIGKGNSWVAYDLPQSTSGFRFSGQSKTKGVMGNEVRLSSGATLQVKAPQKCRIRLIQNGTTVAERENDENLTFIIIEVGAYRAECYIDHDGREVGWIYSNPIYII